MPIPSSSGSSGSGSHSLRKPASTTYLNSSVTPITPNGNSPATSGWKSIFRMPSLRKLNTTTHDGVDGGHAYSAEHGSYHSSRSSGSDSNTNNTNNPNRSGVNQTANTNNNVSSGSPASYKYSPQSPSTAPFSPQSSTTTPRRQKSGFLTRKLSFAKQLNAPLTAQSSQQSFNQSQHSGGASGPSPSSPSKPSSSSATRFLRRVASAPNAKGLFNSRASTTKNGLLAPALEVPPLPTPSEKDGSLESGSSQSSIRNNTRPNRSLTASFVPKVGDPPAKAPFRRTYSSNSMKHRAVEVRPSSFQKIKLLGRGDVGKVYLVREKKTEKLFAMKGRHCSLMTSWVRLD